MGSEAERAAIISGLHRWLEWDFPTARAEYETGATHILEALSEKPLPAMNGEPTDAMERGTQVDDEGELAEALERAWRDMWPGDKQVHAGVFNILGRHLVHHLKDVRRDFAARRAAAPAHGRGG